MHSIAAFASLVIDSWILEAAAEKAWKFCVILEDLMHTWHQADEEIFSVHSGPFFGGICVAH